MILRAGLSVVEKLVCWMRGNSCRMWQWWWQCLRDAMCDLTEFWEQRVIQNESGQKLGMLAKNRWTDQPRGAHSATKLRCVLGLTYPITLLLYSVSDSGTPYTIWNSICRVQNSGTLVNCSGFQSQRLLLPWTYGGKKMG